MLRTRRALPAVTLLAVVAALPVGAAAAMPTIHSWGGKTKQHGLGVQIIQVAGKAAYFTVRVSCTDPSGTKHDYALQAHKLPKAGKVKVTDAKIPGGIGTLSVSTTVPVRHKAVGTLSYTLSDASGGCTGKDSYSLKYAVGHAG